MSKKFLVLGAVVTTLVLLFAACAQPTEFDGASISVNNYGIEPPQNVSAVAYLGAVRITWDAPKTPVTGYRITRKIKDSADEPVVIATAQPNVPGYAVDNTLTGPTKLEDGKIYVYKVVAYNTGGVGNVTAESEEAEVGPVSAPAPGKVVSLPEGITVAIADSYKTNNQANWTTSTYTLKVSGLDPAYSYQYRIQQRDTNTDAWTNVANGVGAVNTNLPAITALNSATFTGESYITGFTGDRSPATRQWRVLLTVGVANDNNNRPVNNWAVSDSAINAPTDASLNATNIIPIGTF
jgi:hypothetical protein